MSDKKSYMNNESILAEGFFSKLAKMLGFSSKKEKILKKDKKINSALNNLNQGWSNIEKHIEREYGQKVKMKKFKLTDFI